MAQSPTRTGSEAEKKEGVNPSALSYVLETAIQKLDPASRKEADAFLESLKTVPQNREAFERVFQSTRLDDRLIGRLKEANPQVPLGSEDLRLLSLSDFVPLLNKTQLHLAEERMRNSELVANTLRAGTQSPTERLPSSEAEWEAFKKKLEKDLHEKRALHGTLKDSWKKGDRQKANDLKLQISLLQRQLKKGEKWKEDRSITAATIRDQEETKAMEAAMAEREGGAPMTRGETISLLEVVRQMRLEAMREYLMKQTEALEERFIKATQLLEPEELEANFRLFEDFRSQMRSKGDLDPDMLAAKERDLAHFEDGLKKRLKSLKKTEKNRAIIENNIREEWKRVSPGLQKMTSPEALKALVGFRQKNALPNPAVAAKDVAALKNAAKPQGGMAEILRAMEEKMSHLSAVSPEELMQIEQQMKQFKKELVMSEDTRVVASARMAMEALQNETDPQKMIAILEEKLGEGYVKKISQEEFAPYQKYTPQGFMVFYQKGSEWKIIVNRDAVTEQKEGKELGRQLSHELLHLVFDKNAVITDETGKQVGIKEKLMEQVQKNGRWKEIKAAFVKSNPKKFPPGYRGRKKTFTAQDWSDEDVMSELYAMQEDLKADAPVRGSQAFSQLRHVVSESKLPLWTALTPALLPKEEEVKIRGFGGAEEGQGEEHAESHAAGHAEAHGNHDTAMGQRPEELKSQIKNFSTRIEELLKSETTPHVPGAVELLKQMKKYNQNTLLLTQQFAQNITDAMEGIIKERNGKIEKALKEIEGSIVEVSANIQNTAINPLRDLWNRTSFISILSIIETAKTVSEYLARLVHRKAGESSAHLGQALFQNTGLGSEFLSAQFKSEHEGVHEWEERYENVPAHKLIEKIKEMARATSIFPSKDELKAILTVLAHKGRVPWEMPELWRVLNRLQKAQKLDPNDPMMLRNQPLMRRKLTLALEAIYHNADEFNKLLRDNEHGLDEGLGKFEPTLEGIENVLGARLEMLLKMNRRDPGSVDPVEFEATLRHCIKGGKSNPETVMFYLFAGIADGLLAADRAIAIDNKFLNNWPATQYWYRGEPLTHHDVHQIIHEHFLEEYENGNLNKEGDSSFKNYYHTVVKNRENVHERLTKKASVDWEFDHDWLRDIAGGGDAETPAGLLRYRSGKDYIEQTAVANVSSGLLQYLEENSKTAEKTEFRKNFARSVAQTFMWDSILDGIAYQKENFTRKKSLDSSVPREAGVGNHGSWTMGQHRLETRKYVDIFDPVFFGYLRDTERAKDETKAQALTEDVKNHLIQHYGHIEGAQGVFKEISKLDDIFKSMGSIIQIIFKSKTDTELLALIKSTPMGKRGLKVKKKHGGHGGSPGGH